VTSTTACSEAVEVTGLVKAYRRVQAVDGLTLRAAAGEVTALLGPNGAGKTTTVEICEGYRRADAGTVRVLGLDPIRDGTALKPRVGVMLQSGGIPPAARPAEYLALLARFHASPLPPGDLIDRLGLGQVARTPVRRLSGGQQQRLSLAAALIGRPELVFLDEPTAGLDPQARHVAWDLVAELRSAGVSVILTTHLMDEAERLAQRVVIIDHGRLITSGTPAELTRGTPQLRLRARPGLDLTGLLDALPAGSSASESPAGHYVIETSTADGPGPAASGDPSGDASDAAPGAAPEMLAAVAAWCGEHHVRAEDLRVTSRTLEDVFLDLTGRELRS
jgi:ABC-2 type transport system ATP-binding protein